MSLRTQAAADAAAILEDSTTGFGWAITVTDPDATSADLTGFSSDIHQLVDPQTGVTVSGRSASVVLRIASLTAAGLGIPVGVAGASSKPWIVAFDDIVGTAWSFKVRESMPDRAIGVVICTLEPYTP